MLLCLPIHPPPHTHTHTHIFHTTARPRYDTLDGNRTVRRIAFGEIGVLDVMSLVDLGEGAGSDPNLIAAFMAPTEGITTIQNDDKGARQVASGPWVDLPKAIPPHLSTDVFGP